MKIPQSLSCVVACFGAIITRFRGKPDKFIPSNKPTWSELKDLWLVLREEDPLGLRMMRERSMVHSKPGYQLQNQSIFLVGT